MRLRVRVRVEATLPSVGSPLPHLGLIKEPTVRVSRSRPQMCKGAQIHTHIHAHTHALRHTHTLAHPLMPAAAHQHGQWHHDLQCRGHGALHAQAAPDHASPGCEYFVSMCLCVRVFPLPPRHPAPPIMPSPNVRVRGSGGRADKAGWVWVLR